MIPLVMSVIAKTETFQRGMARTRGEVGKFDKLVKRSQVTMTGLSRSFLRLAGVGGRPDALGELDAGQVAAILTRGDQAVDVLSSPPEQRDVNVVTRKDLCEDAAHRPSPHDGRLRQHPAALPIIPLRHQTRREPLLAMI